MAIELVKENIEYEQLLGENTADTVVKAEYIIPDTNPDVKEILVLDAKPEIINKEVLQDKVFLEGQIEFNVLYLAKGEDKSEVYNVVYNSKFSNYVEVGGAVHKMMCDAECFVEHIDCTIINERKISVEGIIKLKSQVYNKYKFDIVKDVAGLSDLQVLKNAASIDKVIGSKSMDLVAKSHLVIPQDKLQIGTILKCDINIHKKQTKLFEGKIAVEAFAHVEVLYKGKDVRDLNYVEDDILISGESEVEEVNPTMDAFTDFRVEAMEFLLKEDDLGESRIIDVESLIKADVQISSKADVDIIEDAYSPEIIMNLERKNYTMNVMFGHSTSDTIVKENIDIPSSMPAPIQIIATSGKTYITDKKIVEDKVVVEGLLAVNVIYRTADEDRYICAIDEELPFGCTMDIPGAKIDMMCSTKASLENVEAFIEANTISVKGLITVSAKVNYITDKNFIIDVVPIEGEVPKKRSSVTIYVIQRGDSLWKVAKKYNTTIDNITKVNELEEDSSLVAGEKLIIPGRAII